MLLTRLLRRLTYRPKEESVTKLNLCCGPIQINGFLGIDVTANADLVLDLAEHNLPFIDGSIETVVCMSAINYFSRKRASEIIAEVYRVLKPGGVSRFGVQDLERIARRYVEKDLGFFFEKLPNGKDRFEGPTLGDKFAAWFYGYGAPGRQVKYFYDYPALEHIFVEVGFKKIERREFRDSRLDNIDLIDNRPEQMFFLEAVK